jgi:hypothetical protein
MSADEEQLHNLKAVLQKIHKVYWAQNQLSQILHGAY